MTADQSKVMFLFPGQGSQYPGMGSDICREFPAAKRIYDEADEILGYDLSGLSFNGPEDQLNLTRFTQPALLTHSIACLAAFRDLTDAKVMPTLAAGHSLGEYSALVAAGVLAFAAALRLVQTRGDLMGAHGEGEMLAVPMDRATVQPLAEKHFCAVAACNLAEQTVIGGRSADLDAAAAEIEESFPRKRAARLKTEGAFHTYYMVTAAQHFRSVLEQAEFAAGSARVCSNYTGELHDADPGLMRTRLFFQLFHPVQWVANLHQAVTGEVTHFVEFGGGIGSGSMPAEKRPNLEGIVRKSLRGSDCQASYHAAINSATIRQAAEVFAA